MYGFVLAVRDSTSAVFRLLVDLAESVLHKLVVSLDNHSIVYCAL